MGVIEKMRRVGRAFRFTLPAKAPVAIVYRDRVDLFEKWVLKEIPYQRVEVGEWVCLHPLLLLATLMNLRRIDWRYLYYDQRPLRGMIKQVYEVHLLAYLQRIAPRAVLTFMDNSAVFHRLSKRHTSAEYFAVMNGLRSLIDLRDDLPAPPHPNSRLRMTHFCCFGQHEVDVYRMLSHEVERFHTVGAFVWGCYRATSGGEPPRVTHDICYVSQWETYQSQSELALGPGAPERRAVFFHALNRLEENLARALEEKDLSLLVALRYDDCQEEKAYYREKFGARVEFAESNRAAFSSYRAMDSARVIVTLNSTCCVEAFGAGRKVLFCNVPRHPHFKLQLLRAGCSYLEGDDYAAFKERLEALLAMDLEEYRKLTGEGARYLVNDDPGDPPHEQIRRLVLAALEG
jgi:surface carbohydrate biosynthesis protein